MEIFLLLLCLGALNYVYIFIYRYAIIEITFSREIKIEKVADLPLQFGKMTPSSLGFL